MKENKTMIWTAVILAVGMMLGGEAISSGIHYIADTDRSVSVKGLSTREVVADHAIWPMNFSVSGNDLASLYQTLSQRQEKLVDFLKKQGFEAEDIQTGNVSVSDNWNSYYGNSRPEYKYTLTGSIVISTDKVDLVRTSQSAPSKLLAEGFIVESNEWMLEYQYNGLAELKPSMIEEATKNARAVAQKFADDSNSRLRGIRHASQGQFSVESDSNRPWIKHVRVVTTVDYYLR